MIVMTHQSRGFAERFVMGQNRDRLIRKLKRADRHDRLRVCYPVLRGDCETAVMVHSKLMIIDDQLLRVGSANLNNRSMGVDTECDLAIEGVRDDTRRAINAVRWRLLGEHLDVSPEEIAAATERLGSMVAAIDSFNKGARGMACFNALTTPGPIKPVACTGLLDPGRPFEPLWFLKRRKRRD
jgi:phosphatidylserine/phosphatidylglycerophosphate/cardiolipin synthase-like enzyme